MNVSSEQVAMMVFVWLLTEQKFARVTSFQLFLILITVEIATLFVRLTKSANLALAYVTLILLNAEPIVLT